MRTAPLQDLDSDEFARAFEDGEIQPYFQPVVDLRNARVIGVEALVRWAHPKRGLIPPADFLHAAESAGQMRALTECVVEHATQAAGDWWLSGLGLQLSVNLSTSVFTDPEMDLERFVSAALAASGLPGDALIFEVTETAVMTDPEIATKTLEPLRGLGATISVDDFGTGLSSLKLLMSLPVDEIKVDRSFINDLTESAEDKTIVRSTIYMAHQMGLQVVAEGVETEETWRQLRIMGCERAQGYLIAEPLPAREVPAWLAAWNHRARELSSTSRSLRRAQARMKDAAADGAAA